MCPGHPFDQNILNLLFRPYTGIWFLSQLISLWHRVFSVMVTAVFYGQFLHVFYAAYMFYGTDFMYNHAILCIFSPNFEVKRNIIIIIIENLGTHSEKILKKNVSLIKWNKNCGKLAALMCLHSPSIAVTIFIKMVETELIHRFQWDTELIS